MSRTHISAIIIGTLLTGAGLVLQFQQEYAPGYALMLVGTPVLLAGVIRLIRSRPQVPVTRIKARRRLGALCIAAMCVLLSAQVYILVRNVGLARSGERVRVESRDWYSKCGTGRCYPALDVTWHEDRRDYIAHLHAMSIFPLVGVDEHEQLDVLIAPADVERAESESLGNTNPPTVIARRWWTMWVLPAAILLLEVALQLAGIAWLFPGSRFARRVLPLLGRGSLASGLGREH